MGGWVGGWFTYQGVRRERLEKTNDSRPMDAADRTGVVPMGGDGFAGRGGRVGGWVGGWVMGR